MAANKRDKTSSQSRRRGGPPAARTLLVLFFCAGIAFLGLMGGGDYPAAVARRVADPMIGYYGSDMPRYPGVRELPAGPSSSVGGSSVRMSIFNTEDEPAKVARFYEDAWRTRRLYVTSDVTHKGGVVSAVDSSGGKVYQVLFSANEKGTQVFPSVTSSPLEALGSNEGEPAVPLFPGSKAVLNLGTDDAGHTARVTMSVNDGTLEENMTHYRRELTAAGFEREVGKQPEQLQQGHRILVFRKEGHEVTVNLTALSDKKTKVHMAEVGSE
mgnify:CR=1 FL=1